MCYLPHQQGTSDVVFSDPEFNLILLYVFCFLLKHRPHSLMMWFSSLHCSLTGFFLCASNMPHSCPPLGLCTALPSSKRLWSLSSLPPDLNLSATSFKRPSVSICLQDPFPVPTPCFLSFSCLAVLESILFF